MNAKAKGSKNERRTIALLQSEGYSCTKSGGSLGVFDVIGIGPADVILCQVKSNRWPGAVELDAIREFKAPANARKIVHRWLDRQASPDVMQVE
jgi:Holliday junction resolvase